MKEYVELFVLFFKLGAFTIGGGYVMLPLIQKELVEKKGWYTEEEFLDIIAISQSSPGPIVVNAAMVIGTRRLGFLGGLLSVLAAILPPFAIIYLVSIFFFDLRKNPYVVKMLLAIRPAVIGIIFASALRLSKMSLKKSKKSIVFTILSFALIVFFHFNTVSALVSASLVAYVFFTFFGGEK